MQFNVNTYFMVLLMLLITIGVISNNIKLLFLEDIISRNN